MAETRPKTFADRMRAEAREIERTDWVFGRAFVSTGLEQTVVEGLKAFATLWFLEHTDETELPSEFYRFTDVIDEWNLADTADLEDEEEDSE